MFADVCVFVPDSVWGRGSILTAARYSTGQVADWPAMLTMLRCVLYTPRTAQLLSVWQGRHRPSTAELQQYRPHNLLSVPRTANTAAGLVPVLSVAASLRCCYYVRFRTQYIAPQTGFTRPERLLTLSMILILFSCKFF